MICQPCWVYESPGSRKSMPVSNTVRRLANVFAVVPPPELWAVDVAAVLPAAALFFGPPPPHPAATSATPSTRAPALSHFARCLPVTSVPPEAGFASARSEQTPGALRALHCYMDDSPDGELAAGERPVPDRRPDHGALSHALQRGAVQRLASNTHARGCFSTRARATPPPDPRRPPCAAIGRRRRDRSRRSHTNKHQPQEGPAGNLGFPRPRRAAARRPAPRGRRRRRARARAAGSSPP